MDVRAATAADRAWIEAFLAEHGATRAARRGELIRPIDHPMLIAEADGEPAGLLTYEVTGDDCEVMTSTCRGSGRVRALR